MEEKYALIGKDIHKLIRIKKAETWEFYPWRIHEWRDYYWVPVEDYWMSSKACQKAKNE